METLDSAAVRIMSNMTLTDLLSLLNESLNVTSDPLRGHVFPSGFSLPHIVCACVVITVVIALIVLGNLLVVVAVFVDNSLNQPQNWFIASLAVSDLLLGLLVMPLSLGNEVMGYWPFGDVLCTVWLVTDVLLCTASILNLCLISVDRYKCITDVTYARRRTARRSHLLIAVVWVLSMVICLPPLVGWKRPQPVTLGYPQCELSQEVGYIIYSTLGSFYLPLIVMVVVYFKIYLAARSLARRSVQKRIIASRRQQTTVVEVVGSNGTKTMVLDTESNMANGRRCEMYTSSEDESGEYHQRSAHASPAEHVSVTSLQGVSTHAQRLLPESCLTSGDVRLNDTKPANQLNENVKEQIQLKHADSKSADDNTRSKRKLARARERRATFVLGIIMASFIICWMPFFTTYLLSSIFRFHVHNMIFAVFFWFGYCNSALNPLIYTIFNRDFRQAFLRILLRRKTRYSI